MSERKEREGETDRQRERERETGGAEGGARGRPVAALLPMPVFAPVTITTWRVCAGAVGSGGQGRMRESVHGCAHGNC